MRHPWSFKADRGGDRSPACESQVRRAGGSTFQRGATPLLPPLTGVIPSGSSHRVRLIDPRCIRCQAWI
ncbi:hypothetical protein EYF80_045435 [Liparis tanakae]|uniref:Uncharacterized protein n=1 Tax=Liparis tanakae TaxID=230148 RepID=A0A4Z2FT59_9TELE|nr:hypothetical protein EYF80_045435 [Liparis tanakae]